MAAYNINITTVPNGAGIIQVYSDVEGTIQEEGALVTVFADPILGYTFVGMLIDGEVFVTDNPYVFTMPSSDVAIEIAFEIDVDPPAETYIVNTPVDPVDSGLVKVGSPDAAGNEQEAGALVSVLAIANSGFVFVSMTIGVDVVSTVPSYEFVMPANDVTINVLFEAIPEPDIEIQDSLYDTSCPKFLFIKNLSKRYFMGDLVSLSDTDYTELPDEPIGFDAGTFRLERDLSSHGFNYEFSASKLSYEIGTIGHAYLKSTLLTDGTDADVKFVYGFGDVSAFTIFYIGKLDMNEYAEVNNGEWIEFNLRELDFDNILQTSFDTPQVVEPNKEVLLHSKVIPKTIQYIIEPDDQFTNVTTAFIETPTQLSDENAVTKTVTGLPNFYDRAYLMINSGREGSDDLNEFFTRDFGIITNNDPDTPKSIYDQQQFIGVAKEAGTYRLKIRTTVALDFVNFAPFPTPFPFKLVVAVTQNDGISIVSETEYTADLVETVSKPISPADAYFTFNRDVDVQVALDQCIYCYLLIDMTDTGYPKFPNGITSIKRIPFALGESGESNIPSLVVEAQTFTDPTQTKFISPIDLLDSVFSQANDKFNGTVVSDFFDGGCGEKLFLTNGFNIRGGTRITGVDLENLKIRVAPKDLFEMLSALFCLGWGVEYDTFKNEVVRIEPVDYFYRDQEIMSFDQVSNYSKKIDTDRYYNEIEVGFKKYSKQRETDKGNTLDDFHTKHVYQTPIKTNKKKLPILSDVIMSGYEIEILRRKQFQKDGSNDRSNYSEDENIFGVFVLSTTVFTGGTYLDVNSAESTTKTTLLGVRDSYPTNEIVTYTSKVGVTQNRRIKSTYFIDNDTVIEFYENLIGATGIGNVTITLPSTFIEAEKNEAFTTVDFLVSPESTYNLRMTPKRMLQNHAKLINGGFFTKAASSELIFKQGDGNTKLTTVLDSGDSCKLGDLDSYPVNEGANIIIGDGVIEQASLQQGQFLFLPIEVTFSVSMTFEQLTELKKCLRGQGLPDKNYGYLTITNPCGEVEKIFPTSIDYSPVEDETKITGFLKELS